MSPVNDGEEKEKSRGSSELTDCDGDNKDCIESPGKSEFDVQDSLNSKGYDPVDQPLKGSSDDTGLTASPSLCGRMETACSPLLASSHPLPPSPSLLVKVRHGLLCPPHGLLASLLTWGLVSLTVWGAAYSMLGQVALPGEEVIVFQVKGGTVFTLLVLLLAAWLGGKLVELVHLPPLLGMLIVGILLKNVPGISVARGLDPAWSAATRSIALAVILLRAGLGLDPKALRQLSAMVFRLAFCPCLLETLVVAVTSHLLLDLPWIWSFMLGFVLAAVSPAVVVPCLLSLQQAGWGVAKGIPTLVIAAASVDDVLAISCFTIILGITFNSNSDLARVILQGPLEAVVGVLWGLVWGGLVTILPPQPQPSSQLRIILLVGGSMLALFGSDVVGLPGSGALAVLVMGFTAGLGWRSQGWGDSNPVTKCLAGLWLIFQPLLFSLIGTEIQLSALSPATVGWGVLVLACGLSVRLLVSYSSVLGGQLTHRERLFVSLAWLPKATVQAAIGPLALDKAKQALTSMYPMANCSSLQEVDNVVSPLAGGRLVTDLVNGSLVHGFTDTGNTEVEVLCDMVQYGGQVLTIAVLVILITAPIGAIAIMSMGPRLLEKEKDKVVEALPSTA